MTTCANCHTQLTAPLDEYGPREAPLCMACYLAGASQPDPHFSAELQEAETHYQSCLSDLQDQYNLIDHLENLSAETVASAEEHRGERESERKALDLFQQRFREASDRLEFLRARKARFAAWERYKLEAWTK